MGGRLGIGFGQRVGLAFTADYSPSELRFNAGGPEERTPGNVLSGSGRLTVSVLPLSSPCSSCSTAVRAWCAGAGKRSRTSWTGPASAAWRARPSGSGLGGLLSFYVHADDFIYNAEYAGPTVTEQVLQHDVHLSFGLGVPLGADGGALVGITLAPVRGLTDVSGGIECGLQARCWRWWCWPGTAEGQQSSIVGTWRVAPRVDTRGGPREVIIRADSSASWGRETSRWRLTGDSIAIAIGGEWEVYRVKVGKRKLTLSGGDLQKPITLKRVGTASPRPAGAPFRLIPTGSSPPPLPPLRQPEGTERAGFRTACGGSGRSCPATRSAPPNRARPSAGTIALSASSGSFDFSLRWASTTRPSPS